MKVFSTWLAIAALSASLLIGCGSSDPKTLISEGHAAQGSGDSKTAQAKFSEALKGLKPEDAQFIDAKLGWITAVISTDPKLASEEFIKLADAFPSKVGDKEFAFIGGQMVSAQKYAEALELVHIGIQRAGGESPNLMVQIERIKKEAAGNSEVNDRLKGLGYIK